MDTWSTKVCPPILQEHLKHHHFYLAKDEEDRYEGVDKLFQTQDGLDEVSPKFGPRVEILKEKYLSFLNNGEVPSFSRFWKNLLVTEP